MHRKFFYVQKILILFLICALSTGGLLASDMAAPQSAGNAPAKSTAQASQKSKSHKGSIIGTIVGAGLAAGGAVLIARPTECHVVYTDFIPNVGYVPCEETPPYKDKEFHKKLWGGTLIGVGAVVAVVSLLHMGGPKKSSALPIQKRNAGEAMLFSPYPQTNAFALSNSPIEIRQPFRVRSGFSMNRTAPNRPTSLSIRKSTFPAESKPVIRLSLSSEVGIIGQNTKPPVLSSSFSCSEGCRYR